MIARMARSNSHQAIPLERAVEVVRSLLIKGGIDENGCAVVQGNIALDYRVYTVHDVPFWALIENNLLDGFMEVPRPDLVEAVALEIEAMARAGFDDLAEFDSEEANAA